MRQRADELCNGGSSAAGRLACRRECRISSSRGRPAAGRLQRSSVWRESRSWLLIGCVSWGWKLIPASPARCWDGPWPWLQAGGGVKRRGRWGQEQKCGQAECKRWMHLAWLWIVCTVRRYIDSSTRSRAREMGWAGGKCPTKGAELLAVRGACTCSCATLTGHQVQATTMDTGWSGGGKDRTHENWRGLCSIHTHRCCGSLHTDD